MRSEGAVLFHLRDGKVARLAVQPHDAFLPYLQPLDTAQSRWGKFGAEGGSDGTRTRDLCRDREPPDPPPSDEIP